MSIVPGTADIGNHCDDCTTTVSLPFPVYIYGVPYTSVNVDSNGTLQFTTNAAVFTNVCLPGAGHGRAFFPYWDDLAHGQLGQRHLHDDVTGSPRTASSTSSGAPSTSRARAVANFEFVYNENNQF